LVGAILAVVAASIVECVSTGLKSASVLGVGSKDLRLFADILKLALAAVFAGLIEAVVRNAVADRGPMGALLFCGFFLPLVDAAAVLFVGIATPSERSSVGHAVVSLQRFAPWVAGGETAD